MGPGSAGHGTKEPPMLSKGPHISIDAESLVPRILHIPEKEFARWPEAVRKLTVEIASELFLVRYNPFIAPETVRKSVRECFAASRHGLALHYATCLEEGITMFWSAHESDLAFKKEIIARLAQVLPKEAVDTGNYAVVDNATDSTDLRLELPLLVVTPATAEQVQAVVRLANEMQFSLVPRGGGSGATGGAVPARKRSVILSLIRLNKITEINPQERTITVQAGVITNDATLAAAKHNLLFSVDPASKLASSIGGNIAENAGGPLCFEYGTTIDNVLSYRMVLPTGELIEVTRKDHPRRAIAPEDTAVFEVRDLSGGLRSVVTLPASVIRTPGLGKDVTNKALGGLPGMQKEGTDGVITDATFILHEQLPYKRVMVLEFFGRSMENAVLVVTDIVALRNDIRRRGDLVKITAMEDFNIKYVQAIDYQRKSTQYEGDPISVLIVQLDSNSQDALDEAVGHVVQICESYDSVDSFVAKDDKEAEHFWEDRHKLSMIARRTSGFKINEDVVLPIQGIPEFALYLEWLNLEYAARAYRTALKAAGNLPGLPEEDDRIPQELAYAARIIQGEVHMADLSDEELFLHATLFLRSLSESYPSLSGKFAEIADHMVQTRISVASHMHAGDGNCHVNIPVNSNDPVMLANAEHVAHLVMAKAQELGGEVTGEHGIGITKIAFLTEEKMNAFIEYKRLVDPRNVFNPAKLTQRELPVAPFTFSFNRLIQDIQQSGLADKERLISLLANIQMCTRCGKCKQHCPMHAPEAGLTYYPRNKNLVLGALIEAIYYSQVNTGKVDPFLMAELRHLMDFCTGCGKCMTACPVKIASQEVALSMRGYLEDEGQGGHPIKSRVLGMVAQNPSARIPLMGKLASVGQRVQNNLLPMVPASVRSRFTNPMFAGRGPQPGYRNLGETLHLAEGTLFVPEGTVQGTVLYFPGCGGSVFFRHIGLAAVALLVQAGYAVVLPEKHLCCGYPLLASGSHEAFAMNQDNNIRALRALAEKAADKGFSIEYVLTSCGSCRDGMERHFVPEVFPPAQGHKVAVNDVAWFLLQHHPTLPQWQEAHPQHGMEQAGQAEQAAQQVPRHMLYHAPCHAEVPGMHKIKAGGQYAKAIGTFFGNKATLSPGCCGESGLGAITTPELYNKIRAKKSERLATELATLPEDAPIVVGCPSCKMGLTRILMGQGAKRRVLHTLELMAETLFGPAWKHTTRRTLRGTKMQDGIRLVNMGHVPPPTADDEERDDSADE